LKTLKIKISLLLLSLVLLITIGAVSAEQSSIYVATDGSDDWSGESPTWNGTDGPKLTIQNALSTVSSNGTVDVASGTYYEKEIAILDHVQLTGTGSTSTIIDAQGTGILFYVDESVEALISGFTLRNGNFMVGGGIYNRGNLELTDVAFESNNALDSGGAVYNTQDGELTVTRCNFTENTARNGGAIYNYGTLMVSDSIFTQNTATQGGAITNYSPLTITGSIFNLNQALEMGGALYNSPTGEVIITGSTFNVNTATDTESFGGAIGSYGAFTITESILTNNYATYGGSVGNTGKLSAIATGNWWGNTNEPETSEPKTSEPKTSEPETSEPVNTNNLENLVIKITLTPNHC
jgi:Chlamydia polymorphic membrane protein (Chlamydia_PMP).